MTDEVSSQELQDWVLPLLGLCQEAGAAICAHYHAPGAGDYVAKDDDTPLTRADLASHELLCAGLAGLDPGTPVLSEESAPVDFAQRSQWQRYWLVDPLDGTREFLDRTGDFTINIALIDQHRPILGVLYQPLERVAYVGVGGHHAHRYRDSDNGEWDVSPLTTRRLQPGRPMVVMASPRHRGKRLHRCLDWLEENWGTITRIRVGGALKFRDLAEGQADLYPRFSPCCEWDTAAGHAVLEGAGGDLLGMNGEPLRYNCQESLYSPFFYAIADRHHALWPQLLKVKVL